jgi:hypothetical protein
VTDVDLVPCPRCGSGFREPLWSLTRLEQEATKMTWFELCANCYRSVFGREPPEQIYPGKSEADLASPRHDLISAGGPSTYHGSPGRERRQCESAAQTTPAPKTTIAARSDGSASAVFSGFQRSWRSHS